MSENKFKVGDRVYVINPDDNTWNGFGTVIEYFPNSVCFSESYLVRLDHRLATGNFLPDELQPADNVWAEVTYGITSIPQIGDVARGKLIDGLTVYGMEVKIKNFQVYTNRRIQQLLLRSTRTL